MKKTIILGLVLLLVLPMVFAQTPQDVVWWEHTNTYGNKSHTFTNINVTLDGKTRTYTYEPKEIYEKRFSYDQRVVNETITEVYDEITNTTIIVNETDVDWIIVTPEVSDENYTDYINTTFYVDYTKDYNRIMKNVTISRQVVVENLQVTGNITGGSPLKVKGGLQLVDYDYEGENKIKEIFNKVKNKLQELSQRLTSVENDLQQIQDNGYTGNCSYGRYNSGILVECYSQ